MTVPVLYVQQGLPITSNPSLSIPTNRLLATSNSQWKPGVTYNGGIPNRTTIFTTLSPIGGSSDDTAQINTAIANAGAVASSSSPQVVLLNAGKYNINGNGVALNRSYVTLRGSGLPAAMATGGNLANDSASALNYVSGTWLQKADRQTDLGNGVIGVGHDPEWETYSPAGVPSGNATSTNITADTVPGSFSCTVASAAGLSIGQLVLIDHVTDTDPNVVYNNANTLSGYFNGSLSGTSMTVNSAINGPTGIVGAFVGTFSGTSLTVNSVPNTALGYITAVGSYQQAAETTIFDALGNYKGYILSGSYPNYTMSQSNTGTSVTLVIGGILPFVNDPVFDGVFSTCYGFITGGSFPNYTMDRTNPTLTNVNLTFGGGTRRFFSREDRTVSQLMKITNIVGTAITFETPFYYAFKTAFSAQLSTNDSNNFPVTIGVSVENLGVFGGMGGDGNGNIAMGLCENSWIKGVEAYWSVGTNIGLYACYRCEVRDSFMHETPQPNPGGAGYQSGINQWSSDCLIENCIMWNGNKVIVIRGAGGGNVIGYCYMDDAFGGTYPESPEAGANAAHYGTTTFALIEGCYSHNYQGDTFWGGTYAITVHRNWLSGIRGCSPTGTTVSNTSTTALKNYTSVQGATTFPYGDYLGRRMVEIDYGSFNHNFTGNVLGFSGQSLLSYNAGGFTTAQTTWIYEELDTNPDQVLDVTVWSIGQYQPPTGGFTWVAGQYATILRSGNWDWFTQTQQWHGIGGSNEYGGNLTPPYPSIPNSYYISGIPAFFTSSSYGATTYPWVNPATGATAVLPARARWLNNTPNTL